ncbi:hypothetical protein L0F63_004610 [Massospora cicadina]|nr:hypothetical protein L0F63_004610 [Massospora cicadina]
MGQLAAFGYAELARTVSQVVENEDAMAEKEVEASNELSELCSLGKKSPLGALQPPFLSNPNPENFTWESVSKAMTPELLVNGHSPEAEALPIPDQLMWGDRAAPMLVDDPTLGFSVLFTSVHKSEARTVAFSADGKFVASGSMDTTLKVLEVSKMKSPGEEKPMVRALYDHTEAVNEVAFHPNGQVLASGSDDCCIKLYDMTKGAGVKKAFRYLQDSCPVQSISFHPSGDFLAAGTDSEKLRVYDVKTLQCFTPNLPGHTSGLTQVRFSPDGGLIASSSLDGSIRLWDGRLGTAARTLAAPHGGRPTGSAVFSKSGAYLLTTGLDGIIRLWDIASGKQLKEYLGGTSQRLVQACFDYNESVMAWDARSAAVLRHWVAPPAVSHQPPHPVLCVAASPVEPGLVVGSEDARVRFWAFPGEQP